MRELYQTTQFKKDLKRYRNKPKQIEELKKVLKMLRDKGTVTQDYQPHRLAGEYSGYMECHVENNLLLIWVGDDVIKLIRLGTHSELFK